MQVSEHMTKTVWTCRIDDSLEHAAHLLWEHDCGCLPVVGEHGQLHGMITDRDICMAAYTSGERLQDLQVREAMAIDAASLLPTDSLHHAEVVMRDRGVHRLPVLDDEQRVIGVLTCNDLLRWVDDAGTTGRGPHDAVHLVRTLAAVGAPRHGARTICPDRESIDSPWFSAYQAPTRATMRAAIGAAVAARRDTLAT